MVARELQPAQHDRSSLARLDARRLGGLCVLIGRLRRQPAVPEIAGHGHRDTLPQGAQGSGVYITGG